LLGRTHAAKQTVNATETWRKIYNAKHMCVCRCIGKLHTRGNEVDSSGLSKERITVYNRVFTHERATVRSLGWSE